MRGRIALLSITIDELMGGLVAIISMFAARLPSDSSADPVRINRCGSVLKLSRSSGDPRPKVVFAP